MTYIILGVIAGVVVIFIVSISIVEKKKNKKLKIERDKLEADIKVSGDVISKKIMKIVAKNRANLAKFVPSVGNLKMSDINKEAKDKLTEIKHSRNYRLIKENDDQWQDFSKNLEALLSEKSNNWAKRNQANIAFFQNYEIKEEKKEVKKSKKWFKKKNKEDRES